MAKSIEDFFTAWCEGDADKRNAMIAGAVAEPVFYADPRSEAPIEDLAALQSYVGMFSEMAPGMPVSVTNESQVVNFVRATVQFGEGEQSQKGQYTIDLDANGKMARIVGFPGMGA